jgi:hypothetical protein
MWWVGIWVDPETVTHYVKMGGPITILQHCGEMGPQWQCDVMVEAARGPKLHPTSILGVYEVFEHIHILWLGLWIQPYCNTCSGGVRLSQMTLWCHGWGCKRSQTASNIHIGGIWSVWALSYTVNGHMGAPLHCNTCSGGGGVNFWKNGVIRLNQNEPKWYCGTMVEAGDPHWLHPTSILDVYEVF